MLSYFYIKRRIDNHNATFRFATFLILALLHPHTFWSTVPSFFFYFFTDYVERRAICDYIYDFYLPSVNWGAWDRYPLLLASGFSFLV